MIDQELGHYWKTVVDTIPDGIMIVDTKGTIHSVNKAFESICGYKAEEVIGKSCEILSCSCCDIVRTRNAPHWCSLFRKQELSKLKCHLICKDGRYLQVIKNASLLRDEKGEVIGGVESITDITELLEKDIQIEAFQQELREQDVFQGMIGNSAAIRHVFDQIKNVADSDASIVILGESGTGKELVARAIHRVSRRSEGPYIKVNCAALNESLLETELFGHVKGAFTGAYQAREGRFEAANGGTLFLDEIGDLPLSTQVKLLRVIEEKVIERVGDNHPIDINVRIITATNRDLKQMVTQGLFREDLFFRINVVPIHISPLRERIGDITLLAESFFQNLKLKTNRQIKGISREAMEMLLLHPWPGNVRELKSAFEYAFVTCQTDMIQPDDFPSSLMQVAGAATGIKIPVPNRDEEKKQRLIAALNQTGGHQSKAAEILGVSRVTVWNWMKRYNLRSWGSGQS